MDEEAVGEVVARRSTSRRGTLPEKCVLKVTRREDGIVLLRSVDVSGRPTMTSELTPKQSIELTSYTGQQDILMFGRSVDEEMSF